MKNRENSITRRTAGIALAIVLSVGTLISCDVTGLTDAIDNFGVLIGLEPINTSATVLITDAKTGELVDAKTHITFQGENGSDVIDIYSDPLAEEEISDGILNFGIDNKVSPSESSPAKVQLVMEAKGYVSVAKNILMGGEGTNKFSMKMVKENNKPQGVTSNQSTEGTADETGTVQSDFSVTADSETNSEAGLSVDVPKGTIFKDTEGNNLTGQLTANVTYYDPAEVSAMQSLPFDLEDDEEENSVVLMGAGSFNITDQAGRSASTAEISAKSMNDGGALTYTIKVYNLGRSLWGEASLQAGDKVSVFYYPWNSSQKKELKDQELINLESGGLGVRFNTSEVISQAYVPDNLFLSSLFEYSCRVSSSSFNLNRNGHNGSVKATFSTYGFSRTITFPDPNALFSFLFIFENFPKVDLNYTFTTSSGTTLSGTANICNSPLNVTLPAPSPSIIDAKVDVSLKCKNPGEVVTVTTIPTAAILYRRSGTTGDWQDAEILEWFQDSKKRITGGSFGVSGVMPGENYDFTIKIDTEKRSKTIEITGSEVDYVEELESGICSS